MSVRDKGAPLKVLHLHSTFDAGGKERRAVALMNRFWKGVRFTLLYVGVGFLFAGMFFIVWKVVEAIIQ